LHELQIYHRDLKCANLFLSKEGVLKIGDLNVSKVAKMGMVHTQTGTPYYASPEVWKDQPYDSRSDIWSLGCVFYEMATHQPPFRAVDMKGLYNRVVKGIFSSLPDYYSRDLENMIRAMLVVDPSKRPSANVLLKRPEIKKRMESQNADLIFATNRTNASLLDTIRLPRNLSNIAFQLPKPNYSPHNLTRNSSEPKFG
jgi:NIMA (never in mitosis gene a)-related kinase